MKEIEVSKGANIQIRMTPDDDIELATLKAMAERSRNGQTIKMSWDEYTAIFSVDL